MKKLLLSLALLCFNCLFVHAQTAQNPVLYEAKVYTTQGTKTGILERVYNHGVGIVLNDDVLYIDALDIKEIKVKKHTGSLGSKILGTALIGSITALNLAAQADEDKTNPASSNYGYKTSTLSDNAAYVFTGATIGTLIGTIPSIRKNKKFFINQDSSLYYKLLADMAQYGRYNQLVPMLINAAD
ncbi:hypothetical protein ABDD95_17170 [Mucilaginibacter sp. PAMB04274]|uniref:hypothetical protein n=1 Tax=Mucilaginibacter sp. PAMB04274 TaxID=3138568 RepID=UPI0031F66F81